jgi:hypothetical protein
VELEEREAQGILSCIADWPGKSPDLNMIEPCWSDLKDECHPQFLKVMGSGIDAKPTAREIAASAWQTIQEDCRIHARRFEERCSDVEKRNGNNNVRG